MKQTLTILATTFALVQGETDLFDGPMAGKFYPKTSKSRTFTAEANCILEKITSCNAAIAHTSNWCYARLEFNNCEAVEAIDEECGDPAKRGSCNSHLIDGYATEINMFTSFWKGKKSEPVPSGFRIKTDKGKYMFGDINNTAVDSWMGKARIIGVTLDVSGNADFMQFHLAANKTWWPKTSIFDSPLDRPTMTKD